MNVIKSGLREIRNYSNRNNKSLTGTKSQDKQVNLEWWSSSINVGDVLSKIVYEWMLNQNKIPVDQKIENTVHLMAIGSILGMGYFDAVVWGSGIHRIENVRNIYKQKIYRKYDIRAVRGPVTRNIMISMGYECPEIYGDPAVLMPLVYQPPTLTKKHRVSLILHYLQKDNFKYKHKDVHYIDVMTDDYEFFIDEIIQSELVISSSLHGIILSEAYGVPAIFLRAGIEREEMKFFDWYMASGRNSIKFIETIEEAAHIDPMELPNLDSMRAKLIEAFPLDLWNT